MSLQGQGNTRQQTNTNTRGGVNFRNSNPKALFQGAMNFDFWNGMVTLRFHPVLEPAQQSDFRKFDYDQHAQATVTIDRLAAMSTYIEKELLPALEKGEVINFGFPMSVSSNSLLLLGTAEVTEGEVVPFIGLIPDIDPTTRKPIEFIAVQLDDVQVIQDYDVATGSFKASSELPNGYVSLNLLKSVLDASVKALSNAETHAMRTVQRSWHDRVGAALNITQQGSSSYKGGNANSSIFNKPSNNSGTKGADISDLTGADSSALDDLMNI